MTPTSPDVPQGKVEDSEAPGDKMDGKSIELLGTMRKESVKVPGGGKKPDTTRLHTPWATMPGSPLDLNTLAEGECQSANSALPAPHPLPRYTHTSKQFVHPNKTVLERGASLPFSDTTGRLLSLVHPGGSAFMEPFSFHYSGIIVIINHFCSH